ncbi:DUF1799 domain-containing protein [Pseudomonas sp. SbB1]|nr:DUF1799 domain-containing protein [Pseudomonas sp. T34]NOG86746.1 DUF1799 domain-containing protein [Pseudomonas sp. SbB1]HDS1711354.1 DUF1799 domain-containing protein [Pseudomonas putida]HDS1749787.1 DUF1799 domain-containing protein [Pseudomonas putida]
MTLDDMETEEVEVWPDAWPAFCLFEALGTQWRLGPGGPSGLDYAAIPGTAKILGLKRRELPRVFHDLRIMEGEALAAMAETAE